MSKAVPLALPRHVLRPEELAVLELMLGGLLAPADAYCLPGQGPADWPAHPTLRVPPEVASRATLAGGLLLTDPQGTPLAQLRPTATAHEDGEVWLAGQAARERRAEHGPARRRRITAPVPSEHERPALVAIFHAEPTGPQVSELSAHPGVRNGRVLVVLVALAGSPEEQRAPAVLATLDASMTHLPDAEVRLLVVPAEAAAPTVLKHVLTRLAHGAQVLTFPTPSATPHGAATEGTVVLLTGLSGSGKSTLARAVSDELRTKTDRCVTLLDGDEVRLMLSSGLGFSPADRELNVRRIGWVAALAARHGGIALCAPIAPYDAVRQEVRAMAEEAGRFLLVHVATPLEECERRDRKGLYAQARAGLIPAFTGVSDPYEEPGDADLVIDTSVTTAKDGARLVTERVLQPARR
ncbi:adenylyl-sulfate kinase [Georgenia sp. AZ-5]|uniref:adenylyl-sulfate kinase n=1 Tax=Georgenia sp. AZ-5 TaxID=3367526 RepID=UPI0037553C2A